MNFVGKFDAKPVDDPGAHSDAPGHVEGVTASHVPPGAIIVPDAQLLFHGDFKRAGVDLILSSDDHELVLHDYFKGEKRATLASPDGAHLTGDLVNALSGHVEYAQADGSASAGKIIGHVTKLTGTATAVRNGVSIVLNQGDNVEKGDVVQSGSGSTVGITFIDGTVFGLSANAKMVLNEMVYDPNGSNNSSLISLVAGTISFVAGETAKHGDMKVDTPVATMGIRGTAVLVEIDFDVPGQGGAPDAKFQVLVEPDGTTGSYILYDKTTLAPIATVNQAGQQINISQGVVSQTLSGLSTDVQKLITEVFAQKFTDSTNTKTFDHFTDTPVPISLTPIILPNKTIITPIIELVAPPSNAPATNSNGLTTSVQHINQAPTVVTFNDSAVERAGLTHSSAIDTASGVVRFVDINAGDLPTVKTAFGSFTYQNAQHTDVTATLSAQQIADITAVEATLTVVQAAGNNNNGSATWTYNITDGALDFLAAGETLTLTYVAEVDSNYAPNNLKTFQTFTVTITGTNDAPVITTGPQTVTFSAGINTPGGDLTTTVPTSGQLSFTDADLTDTHTVATKLTSAVLAGSTVPPGPLNLFENALSATIGTDSTGTGSGTIDWKLADLPVYLADFIPQGQTLTLTYTVTVTDSQHATSTQNVIVTITGTATAAVVWIATTTAGAPSGGLWSDASDWETGTVPTASDDAIIITNQLIGLTPSYPVTINAPAFAKSVTMNDFGTSPPVLINQSTLTIAGTLSLGADSDVENSGTIIVGGLMEVLDTSVLNNSGQVTLQQGGDFKTTSTISNTSTGTIEVSGGTLNVAVAIANAGHVTVDPTATLALNGAAIDGGTVANDAGGILDLTGSAVLKNGSLGNAGQINVSGTGNALDHETVTSNHALEILTGGALTVDQATTIANGGGTITVDGTATLTLNGATITGGTLADGGTINSTGTNAITNAAITNTGILESTTGVLTISSSGGVTVTNSGTLEAKGGELDITTEAVTNTGTLQAIDNSILKLTTTTVINTGGTVTVGAGSTLDLVSATISGGALTNHGIVDIETGIDSPVTTLDGVAVAGFDAVTGPPATPASTIEVGATSASTLLLEDGTTIASGMLTMGGGSTLDVEAGPSGPGATLDGVSVTGNDAITGETTTPGSLIQVGGSISAILTLDDGTTFAGGMLTIGLDSTVEIAAGSTDIGATLDGVSVSNSGAILIGNVKVLAEDPTLTLDDGTAVTGGTLSIGSGNTLDIEHGATGPGAALHGVTVSAADSTGTIEVGVSSAATLLLDDGTSITKGALSIGSGSLLDVEQGTNGSGVTLDGVKVTGVDAGTGPTPPSMIEVGVSSPGTLTLDDGASITGGTMTIGSLGVLDISHGTVTLDDIVVSNSGKIQVDDGATLVVGADAAISGPVTATIANGGSADFVGSATETLTLNATFSGAGTLELDHSQHYGGTISGFGAGTTIDLSDLTYASVETDTWNSATHTLTIANGTQTASLKLAGTFSQNDFALASDAAGNTELVSSPAQASLTGLDSAHNAVVGSMVTAGLIDPNATGITYQWLDDGVAISGATGSSYTPTTADLGNALDVVVGFTDGNMLEHVTALAGTVHVPPAIVSETNPSTETVALAASPTVLGAGITTNALGLPTETFDNLPAGPVSNNGFGHGDFVDSDLGATFTGAGNAGIVNGSSAVTAAPFVGPLPGHADTTNYLSIGANGSETIAFAAEQNVFGLYWGSVDSYNTITFYDGAELVASYTGADVSPLFPNGNQGSFSSNAYVEFSDLPTFNTVVLASSGNAFEIDNISAGFVSHQLDSPITGTLTVSDADVGDALTASVIGNAIVKYDGSTTLPSDANVAALIDAAAVTFDSVVTNGGLDVLHWTYNPINPDLDFLTPGHTLTITFEAQVSDGQVVTGDQPLTVTLVDPDVTIAAGGSFQISASSADIVLFAGSTGTLVLDNPSSFTGKIGGISGSGDVLDLGGVDAAHDVVVATTGSGSYDSSTGMTSLIVTDQTTSHSVTLNLAGDYSDSTWNVTADGNGGAAIVDPPSAAITSGASLGAHTIATGGSLEIASAAAATETLTFQGSTGSLNLDTPSSFSGTIAGFTGDGTLAGSDHIDLKGIDFHSSSFAESFNAATDTVSVTDGTDSASLHFAGSYVAANFSFASDGNGGTIVYDPPVSANPPAAPAKTATASVASETSHGFVFNFANAAGHDAAPDFHHGADEQHPILANAQAALGLLHDDGHGNMALVPDGHDQMALAAIIKAQFHADFHFV